MASRLESLSRPNGVTLFLNSLPLNKKNNITISLKELEFAEVTHDVRGIGKTNLLQWKSTDGSEDNPEPAEATSNSAN